MQIFPAGRPTSTSISGWWWWRGRGEGSLNFLVRSVQYDPRNLSFYHSMFSCNSTTRSNMIQKTLAFTTPCSAVILLPQLFCMCAPTAKLKNDGKLQPFFSRSTGTSKLTLISKIYVFPSLSDSSLCSFEKSSYAREENKY